MTPQEHWTKVLRKARQPGSVVLHRWLSERIRQGTVRDARAKRMYAGAQFNRLNTDWISSSTSHDAELRTSLRVLRNRTRQLVRDNDYAKNAVRIIRNNVVGTGVGMQAQVMMRRGKRLDDIANDAIEEAWNAWCRPDSCHTAGLSSFAEMQRMVIAAIAESGEVLIRKVRRTFGRSKVRLALELIEADQLVEDWSGRTEGGNEVRMGVEVDEWRRPIAYWLYPRHPGDYQFVPGQVQTNRLIRVPAEEVIHLYIPARIGATRSASWFDTAIKRLHNMGGYEEAEIIAARAAAAVMGFIQSPESDDSIVPDDVEDGKRVTDLEPGTIQELGPGETFNGWNPSRNNAAVDPFLRLMLRGAAAGIGLSYESLSRDYSQSNYSSSRLALMEDRENWRSLQGWFVEHFLQPVFDEWMELAVLGGVLNFPDYEDNRDRYRAVRWKPRGWSYIDPQKEVKAYFEGVRSGFMTMQDVVSSTGQDIEEIMKQRRRELDLAKELGLVFDTDPSAPLKVNTATGQASGQVGAGAEAQAGTNENGAASDGAQQAE